MPAAGYVSLSKGEVLMYLALSGLNRTAAATMAGVSRSGFFRLMKVHRVQAPKPQAILTPNDVRGIRMLLGKHTTEEVARMFSVHKRTIEKIDNYETWYQVK